MNIQKEKKTPARYPRPALEIEIDKKMLVHPGCCRFVPLVIRLLNIPPMEVSVTVTLCRERTRDQSSVYTEDYQTQPRFCHPPAQQGGGIAQDWEFRTELLARPHETETGTIMVSMSSHFGTELSKAEYRLDTRHSALTQGPTHGFTRITIFDHILSEEERQLWAVERVRLFTATQTQVAAQQPTLF